MNSAYISLLYIKTQRFPVLQCDQMLIWEVNNEFFFRPSWRWAQGPVQNKKSMCFGHRFHKKYDWIFLVEKFIYMIKTCFQLKPRVLFMFLLVFWAVKVLFITNSSFIRIKKTDIKPDFNEHACWLLPWKEISCFLFQKEIFSRYVNWTKTTKNAGSSTLLLRLNINIHQNF